MPRVFEKVYAKILAGVDAGSPVKRKILHWAMSVGRDVSQHQQRGQPVPAGPELKRRVAHKLVFAKLHAALGGRLEWAVSGGAPPHHFCPRIRTGAGTDSGEERSKYCVVRPDALSALMLCEA